MKAVSPTTCLQGKSILDLGELSRSPLVIFQVTHTHTHTHTLSYNFRSTNNYGTYLVYNYLIFRGTTPPAFSLYVLHAMKVSPKEKDNGVSEAEIPSACIYAPLSYSVGVSWHAVHVISHVHTHIHTHIHAHIHSHIHLHTHTYIHTHIHTRTPTVSTCVILFWVMPVMCWHRHIWGGRCVSSQYGIIVTTAVTLSTEKIGWFCHMTSLSWSHVLCSDTCALLV